MLLNFYITYKFKTNIEHGYYYYYRTILMESESFYVNVKGDKKNNIIY